MDMIELFSVVIDRVKKWVSNGRMKHLILIAAFTLFPVRAPDAQQFQALPVDEAAQDPEFKAYRDRLLAAVVARDIDAILQMADTDVHLSFGGISGRDQLRAFLEVDPDQLSEDYKYEAPAMRARNWYELEAVLRMGGVFEDDGESFAAPYTWTYDLPEEFDPFETYFVTGSEVVLRDRPIRWGKGVARLDYDVVKVIDEAPGTGYAKIRLVDGTTGYAHLDYLRSVVDYRALFAKPEGEWQMMTFIAGD